MTLNCTEIMMTLNKKTIARNKTVKLYKKILKGEQKRFPKGYWKDDKNKKDAKFCSMYLIEVVLGFYGDDVYKLKKKHFNTYMLRTMLEHVYNDDVYKVVSELYPKKYVSWRFPVPKGYWTEETTVKALREVVEINNLSRDELIKQYGTDFLKKIGLGSPVKNVYNYNIYALLEQAFPNQFEVWELRKVSHNFWTRENAKIATKWLMERLDWSKEKIKYNLTKNVFKEYGLGGMLKSVYNNSVFAAISDAYPGEFERFELAVSKGYWTEETCRDAIRFMIEKELGFTSEEVKGMLSREHFKKFRLIYPVKKIHEGDYYLAIDDAYPGIYRRSELKCFKFRQKRVNDIVKYIYDYE